MLFVSKGEIPSWVRGSLYRNGPGMFEIGDDKYNSWFDGLAMFQRFHIGKVIETSKIFKINKQCTISCASYIECKYTEFGKVNK